MLSAMSGALEISGSAVGLIDDDLVLRVRGAGPDGALTWRARLRDDDGRVWRATAQRAEELATRWVAAKEGTGAIVALRSLRPVSIDVRAEAADGRAAARTITRAFSGDGVRTRRWRDGLEGRLHLPSEAQPCATVVVDATAGEPQATVARLAAALLASRGVLVLVVLGSRGRDAAADPLQAARERLSALPAARGEIELLAALDPFDPEAPADGIVLPPGIGARDPQSAAAARAVAWDELLERLGARPRDRAAAP